MMATVSKVQIDKDIEQPSRNTGSRGPYPFSDMEVGDSFFAPGVTTSQMGNRCQYYKLRYGRHFTARKVDGGVRVWRVA